MPVPRHKAPRCCAYEAVRSDAGVSTYSDIEATLAAALTETSRLQHGAVVGSSALL